jgi:hypothetical protein
LALAFLFAFVLSIAPRSFAAEVESSPVSILLPSEIPFNLILPQNGGVGFVDSDAFRIANNGPEAVTITLDAARVHLADPEHFTLATDGSLPAHGNDLYLYFDCIAPSGDAARYILTDTPTTTHSFWLEGGESATFQIGGVVSERGDAAWSDTTVTVSVCFTVVAPFAPIEEAEILEPEEEIKAGPDDEAPAETPDGTTGGSISAPTQPKEADDPTNTSDGPGDPANADGNAGNSGGPGDAAEPADPDTETNEIDPLDPDLAEEESAPSEAADPPGGASGDAAENRSARSAADGSRPDSASAPNTQN